LVELANAPEPGGPGARRLLDNPQFQDLIKNQVFVAKKLQFFSEEGAALLIDASQGDGGTVFVQGESVPQELSMSSPRAMLRSLFLAIYLGLISLFLILHNNQAS